MPDDRKQTRHQQSHQRILDAAARAICRDGCAGLGVANVMKEAGLTHGGFYAHFASRDALLAEAVEHAGARNAERLHERLQTRSDAGASPLRALVEQYLSEQHVDAPADGCPVAALGAELGRGDAVLRQAGARRVQHLVKLVEGALPAGSAAGSAAVVASTLVGTVQMARMLDAGERKALLAASREALIAQYDRSAQGKS